jgi:COP9 signalosome complex subunit 3
MANLYRSLARPYEAIADIFKKGNSDRLKAEVDVGRSIWQMVGDITISYNSLSFTE